MLIILGILAYIFIAVLVYKIVGTWLDHNSLSNYYELDALFAGSVWPVAVPFIVTLISVIVVINVCSWIIEKVSGGRL